MKYIYITYDAVLLFASDRFLQSSENEASSTLCDILRQKEANWSHPLIHLHYTDKGIVFFSKTDNIKKALVFDLDTFRGFTDDQDNRTIINIFQKTIKYAVRYFENLPLASCERILPDSTFTIIFPNPFVATHDVPKIIVDRNTSKLIKKDCNYLTVYDYSVDDRKQMSSTNVSKAYDDVRVINFAELLKAQNPVVNPARGFSATQIECGDLKLDSRIGYDQWLEYYLTDVQRGFVTSDFVGPERLEGAAGTGKTLCLILRCIFLLNKHIEADSEYHIIFFTHSLSTKERIIEIFQSNWEFFEYCEESTGAARPKQSIYVTTLQEWSANHLGTNSISDSEYLDKDAAFSKQMQLYYIDEAFKKIQSEMWSGSFDNLCSERFKNFIKYTPDEHLMELFRQEIAVLIKGRAGGEYEVYKSIPRPEYSLPLEVDADYKYTFLIYNRYQDALMKVGQYDSDDITLTALGQVKTPIWNRRRIRDGYDACVVDETHLFNINELSVFHFVNKPNVETLNNIIFAIDKSQSTGDWGIDDMSIKRSLGYEKETENKNFNTVFRSSPDIVNLAFNILSSGANMFTHFENPLEYASFDFVREDEQKAVRPIYRMVENDEIAISNAIEWAESYCTDKKSLKSGVLIIGTTDFIVNQISKKLASSNKPFVLLQSRSDIESVRKANAGNKFIVSSIEYVGGLEFDAVIIVGVDDGRVPPANSNTGEAYHVLNYAWHSKMYVAVTRAKYAVVMFGDVSRGACTFLYSSITSDSVDYEGPSLFEDE